MDDVDHRRIAAERSNTVPIKPAEGANAALVANDDDRPWRGDAQGDEEGKAQRRAGIVFLAVYFMQGRQG